MKPNFALHILQDSLALLHRTPHGWLEIGSTPLDTPDLSEAMSYLRRSALGLEPHGMSTKLIIPNSEILYLQLAAPGPDDLARDAQIRTALEGRTPYQVDELVFDWSGDGPVVEVAVVARDTLREAEEFATNFRLNPVSFAAIPDPARFAGEPWFGPSDLADKLLAQGDFVERDAEVTRPLPRPAPRMADPVVHPADAAVAMAAPVMADPVMADPAPQPAEPELPPLAEPAPAPEPLDPPPPAEEPAPAPLEDPALTNFDFDEISDLPTSDAALLQGLDVPVLTVDPYAEDDPDFSDFDMEPMPEVIPPVIPPALSAALAARRGAVADVPPVPPVALPPTPPMVAESDAILAPPARKAPAAPLTPPGLGAAQPLPQTYALQPDVENEPLPDQRPQPDAVTARPALPAALARRAAQLASPPARKPKTPPPPRVAPPVTAPPVAPPIAAPMAAPALPVEPPVVTPVVPPVLPPVMSPVTPPPLVAKPGISAPADRRAKPKATPAPAKPRPEPVETLVAPPPGELLPGDLLPAELATAARGSEAALLKSRPRPRRGKPRYLGLALTVALLLALALVAAWASFTAGDNSAPPAIESGALQPDPALDPAPVDQAAADPSLPSPEDEALADGLPPEAVATDAAADPVKPAGGDAAAPAVDLTAATASQPVEGQPATAVPPPLATAHSQPAPVSAAADQPAAGQPAPAAVSAAGTAPALTTGLPDTVTLATTQGGLVLLPPPAALVAPQTAADAAPQAPAPPPPFGTQYEFDADGLIKPTPEGIVTPEGYRLVAGPPPALPEPRPADHVPATAAAAAPLPGADTAAEAPPAADPALAGFRPRPRPEGLTRPTADPAADDGAALAPPPADLRLAALRPQPRPAAIEAAARQRALYEEALRVAEAASLSAAASAAALAAAPQAEAAVIPMVLPVSPRPKARPRDFSRSVETAVSEAARPAKPQPEAEEPVREARRAEPGEDEEPVAAAAKAPKVPTKASVSKNATYANAIDLGKTNLIGVYGTPSKRHALIRTSNGRYKKVKVGDRIDGGTVAAITETELRYRKGSRMLTLSLPRG